jgi:hypothetical protein
MYEFPPFRLDTANQCVIWTHAEEVNAELLSFLGEEAVKARHGGA